MSQNKSSIETEVSAYSEFVLQSGTLGPAFSESQPATPAAVTQGKKEGRTLPANGRTYSDLPSDERGWALGMSF